MSNGWKSLPVSAQPQKWHVGAGKHLGAVGSLSMPSFMLHFPPKYAYASLVWMPCLQAFPDPQILLTHSGISMILSFKCHWFVYILSTHSKPSIMQEKNSSGVSMFLILRGFKGTSLRVARCACAGQSYLYAPWSSSASLLALWRLPRKRAWQWGYQS